MLMHILRNWWKDQNMIIAQTLLCFEYTRNISLILQQLLTLALFQYGCLLFFFVFHKNTCACKSACNCKVYWTHLPHYD